MSRARTCVVAALLAVGALAPPAQAQVVWQLTYPGPLQATSMRVFPDGTAWASHGVHPRYHLVRSTDYGLTWQEVPGYPDVSYVGMVTPRAGYLLTWDDEVLATTDGWATSRPVALPGLAQPMILGASRTGRLVVAGWVKHECVDDPDGFVVATSDNGGRTWRRVALDIAYAPVPVDVDVRGDTVAIVVRRLTLPTACALGPHGDDHRDVWLSTDAGRSFRRAFTMRPGYGTNGLECVAVVGPGHLVTGDFDGTLRLTRNGGRTWSVPYVVPPPKVLGAAVVSDMEFTDARTGRLVTQGAGMWVTHDGGLTWTEELSTNHALGPGRPRLSTVGEHGVAAAGFGFFARVPLGGGQR